MVNLIPGDCACGHPESAHLNSRGHCVQGDCRCATFRHPRLLNRSIRLNVDPTAIRLIEDAALAHMVRSHLALAALSYKERYHRDHTDTAIEFVVEGWETDQ
jgi:hypothetical protein